MAVKSALAATLAWAVALRLPGTVADYSFYAPFGAVVTMYPALMRSAAAAARGVGAIVLAPERQRLASLTDEARTALGAVEESARGNRRARHQRRAIARRREELGALERAVLLVDDIYDMARDEPWGKDVLAVSATFRAPMAAALEQLAAALTSIGPRDTTPGRRADADAAVRELATALTDHERRSGPNAESLVVASVVTTLRRTLSVLTPADRFRLSPAPGADDAAATHDAPEGRRGGGTAAPA